MKIFAGKEKIGHYKNKQIYIDWDYLLNKFENRKKRSHLLKNFCNLIILISLVSLFLIFFLEFIYGRIIFLNGIIYKLQNIYIIILINFLIISSYFVNLNFKKSNNKINFDNNIINIEKYFDIEANEIFYKTYKAKSGDTVNQLKALLKTKSKNQKSKIHNKKIEPYNTKKNFLKKYILKIYENTYEKKQKYVDSQILLSSFLQL